MLPVSAQQPIQHVVIKNKIKVKFPTAVSLCAYAATRMGIYCYSLQYHSSVQLNMGYRIKAFYIMCSTLREDHKPSKETLIALMQQISSFTDLRITLIMNYA